MISESSIAAPALMIVAHPDDETIWGGGLMLRFPNWDWTVLSLCRAGDPDRRPKFERVCARLNAACLIADLDDSPDLKPVDPLRDIGAILRQTLGGHNWGLCVTHGAAGEYGHLRHRQTHEAVLHLVRSGELSCRAMWAFAYDCNAETGVCVPAAHADILLPLTEPELVEKRRILQELYGFSGDAFELKACIRPESFQRVVGTTKGTPK